MLKLKNNFVALVFVLGFVFTTLAQQPSRIELNPNGISKIYSPFDASGGNWSLTQWHAQVANNEWTHYYDDWYAVDQAFVSCTSEWRNVRAPISGRVMMQDGNNCIKCYGNTIIIVDESRGMGVRLGHFVAFAQSLTYGDYVTAGQVVGFVGNTGFNISGGCGGYHLHTALYSNIRFVAQSELINGKTFSGILGLNPNYSDNPAHMQPGPHAAEYRFTAPVDVVNYNGTWYVLAGGYKVGVTEAVAQSWGWNMNEGFGFTIEFARNISYQELNSPENRATPLLWPPQNGTLFRNASSTTVYLMENGAKKAVSADQFSTCGTIRSGSPDLYREIKTVSDCEFASYFQTQSPSNMSYCPIRVGGFENIWFYSYTPASCGNITTGSVTVDATLNGSPWSGNLNYFVVGPNGTLIGNAVPGTTSNLIAGNYYLSFNGGGPGTLSAYYPSNYQTLNSGGNITFTLRFTGVTPTPTPVPTPSPPPTSSPITWEFNSNGYAEGWNFSNLAGWSVNSGNLFLDPNAGDYYMYHDTNFTAFSYRTIHIRMASNGTDGTGAVYFKTSWENWYSEDKKLLFTVYQCGLCGNAPFYEYWVPTNHPKWTGSITGIRLDPSGTGIANTNTDSIGVDFIRVLP